jgi:hypothetical protein
LPTTAPRAFDQRHQHVKGAPAELDRLAVGDQLAAMRRYPETPERDARRWFGGGIHQPPLWTDRKLNAGVRKYRKFQIYSPDAQRLSWRSRLAWRRSMLSTQQAVIQQRDQRTNLRQATSRHKSADGLQ